MAMEHYSNISIKKIISSLSDQKVSQIKSTLSKYFKDKLTDQDLSVLVTNIEKTNEKYAQWITKQLTINEIQTEDLDDDNREKIQQLIANFDKFKNNFPANYRDINKLTKSDLSRLLEQYAPKDLKSKREKLKEYKHGELIIDRPPYKVIKITKPEGAVYWAQDTKWCTKGYDVSERYLEQGPLYVIIKNDEKFAQLHFESKQLMDVKDNTLQGSELEQIFHLLTLLSEKEDIFAFWIYKNATPEQQYEYLDGYFSKHPNLEGYLDLQYSQLKSLPNSLKSIGGGLYLQDSQIESLSNSLKSIGGSLNLYNSKLTTLPNSLKSIGGRLDLRDSQLTSLPYSLKSIGSHLYLENSKLTSLPDSLKSIGGSLDLRNSKLTSLPNSLESIGGNLNLQNSKITSLSNSLKSIGGSLHLQDSKLTSLPDSLELIGGSLYLRDSQLTLLPNSLESIGGSLDLQNSELTSLPNSLKSIGGDLNLQYSELISLPDSLKSIGGHLDLRYSKLTLLPNSLESIGKNLYLGGKDVKIPPTIKLKGKIYN